MVNATPKQQAYIVALLAKHGKATYQDAKTAAGIERDKPIPRLTRWEASLLIDRLKQHGGAR